MIKKLLKFSYAVLVVGLLFAQYAWTAPANDDLTTPFTFEYFVPAPVEPQLSSDGNVLYNGVLPVVYVDNPNPSYEPLRIPARFHLLNLPESATATFSITYVANGGTDPWGVSCYTFPDEAKTAFEATANIWANILQSSVPITISACWADLGSSSTLGYSGGGPLRRDFTGAPLANTWYTGSLANALAGSDLDPTEFDMYITYNRNFSWYYGTDGNPPSTQHDLMTVVLHEIAHGLNFSGSMAYSGGQGSWGYSTGYPNIYDTFMRDGSGNQLINTGVYANPSTALGSAVTSNDIWFLGSNAMAANSGQRVKMYAPSTWSSGSSYSHLDYDTFNNTSNQLMVYAISAGESIHDPGPITKGILKDFGWNISAGPTCTYSISPTSQSFDSNGGTGSVGVTTQSGCSWTAVSNSSWITITSNSSGTGSGTVNYSVASNTSTSARTGTITIAGRTFTVSQEELTTLLWNGVPQSGSITGSSAHSNWVYYYVELGSGATNLVIDLYNLPADADLYVRRESKPTISTYDCRSWNSETTNEQCSFSAPSSGKWWMGVSNWDTGTISYTIKATWSGGGFTDVPPAHWAYNYIMAIYNNHITVGCSQNPLKYCPDDNVTRGQMAAFIIRAKYGETFSYTTTPYFTDVPSTHTFFKYVQKLRDDGITAVSGTYGVDTYVTRGQMAAFIVRAKHGENFSYSQTPYFTDVPSTHGFFKYVQKLRDDGITTLTGTYYVDNNVTRAEMAAFLARAFLGMQ
jgi:hypothetical protein